jgi:hypothetical protein
MNPSSITNSRGKVTIPNTGHNEYVNRTPEIMPRAVASFIELGAVCSQSSLTPQRSLRYLQDRKWEGTTETTDVEEACKQ